MEIRKLKKEEFEILIDFIDDAFEKVDGEKFIDILPKLYYKENTSMIHYGLFENGELQSIIGVYPEKIVSKYGILSAGGIGAVSTNKSARGKGYFSKILNYALDDIKNDYDLLFLGGDRYRYNHFGFENAGRTLIVELNNRTRSSLKPAEYTIRDLTKDDHDLIEFCLNLYNKEEIRVLRTKENFYDVTRSWKSCIKVVYSNNIPIGYFSISRGALVFEYEVIDGYIDTIFDAILSITNKAFVFMNTNKLSTELLSKVDDYKLEHSNMYKILNLENVLKFLGINSFSYHSLSELEIIKILLGSDEKEGLNGSLHISTLDKS